MNKIFTPWQLNNQTIKNRIMRSGTVECLADAQGRPGQAISDIFNTLAKNNVGLIVGGMAYVNKRGRAVPRQTGIYADNLLGGLSRLTEGVHKNGGLLAAQLVHAGGISSPDVLGGLNPVGPSAGVNPITQAKVDELTHSQIEDIITDFGRAALRAKKAGYDAVQLYMAHCLLIGQFISPYFNQRTDEYGDRELFPLNVYKEARRMVGPDYPLFAKVNAVDNLEGGLEFPDALELMRKLDKLGIDAIEISGGMGGGNMPFSPSRKVADKEDDGYFYSYALQAKKLLSCPVICVGGWRAYNKVEQALDKVDAIALSRPLLAQPDLISLWAQGRGLISECTSCNKCFAFAMKSGLACILHQAQP